VKSIIICLLVLSGIEILYGQVLPSPTSNRSPRTGEEARQREFENNREAMERLSRQASTGGERSHPTKTLSDEERKKFKVVISPNPDDLEKHKDFLKRSKTGIFLLLPDFDCETKYLIRTDANCANFVPGTWAYSLRRKNYSDADFHDIRFNDDSLSSSGLLNQGILVSLGDVPLESISLNSDGVKHLADFKPSTMREEASNQFEQIAKGIKEYNYVYSKKTKVVVNNTYAMRLVAYKFEDKWLSRFNNSTVTAQDLKFFQLEGDKRVDLTVAFRVISKNADGGITILWKELDRKESPKIVFQKNEKLADIKSDS
jgi:hypothetical protein